MSKYLKASGLWGETATDYYDTVNNNWIWHDATNYYISALVGQPLSIGGVGAYTPSGWIYNAKDYRVCGSLYLWYDASLGYVISSYLGFGTAEDSETVDGVTTWSGDAWWSCSTLTGSYTARGSGHGGAAKVVANAPIVGRYKAKGSPAVAIGEYAPVTGSGLTGNRYFGLARYDTEWGTDGEGIFTQSLTEHNSKPTFSGCDSKVLWWDTTSSKWIISTAAGTKTATVGYWKSATIAGTYSRVFEQPVPPVDPPNVAPAPESYTLVFKDYIAGSNKESVYLSQVALWL